MKLSFAVLSLVLMASSLGYAQQETRVYRYSNGAGINYYRRSPNLTPPPGFALASTNPVFNVYAAPAAGLETLYRCHQGPWQFLSVDAGCEGSMPDPVGPIGYVSMAPQPGTIPLYRDRSLDWSKSVTSVQPYTQSQVSELLGYVPQQ